MRIEGWQRKVLALAALGGLAGLSWLTMEAGRPRWLVVILLAGFALRILPAGSGDRAAQADAAGGGHSQGDAGSGYDRDDGKSE